MMEYSNKVYQLCLGLTNRCNINCVFCPVRDSQIKRMDMPFDLVKRILNEVKTPEVSLALFGDSTLYDRLPEVIGLIKSRPILYTNAVALNDKLITEIVRAGLKKIIFSIDAFDREEYKRVKGGDHFDKVMNNLYKTVSVKKSLKSDLLIIARFAGLNYTTPQDVIDKRLSELRKIATVVVSGYISWSGDVGWGGRKEQKMRQKKPCWHLFRYINIDSNGDMVMCCTDYKHSFVAGNVNDGNVMDIWNCKKFNELRQAHLRGDFPDMCLKCEKENYHE